ncbi:hypothetical protein [Sphingomonas sp. TDK1]|uniref:hypothetical protein n=1 Tax=Sphingomonas sp. TDK1 TaxID=453247 RepID=UPI0007D99D8B|nr:hypothetical protein [Sphingomonas sp. TDK1]OAN61538.1 CopG family transcriptional regulator [Sphingomonas sp. TDK1]
MQTRKTRHQFYLPDELSAKLDAMAAQPGSSKTAILTDALIAWFDRRAGHELDQRFGARLDRQNRVADRMEQKLDYLTEALGLFVRHQLTLTAHQPAFDTETQRLGRLRYDAFIELVGRAIARGDTNNRIANRQSPELGRDR